MSVGSQVAARDFSRQTVRTLCARGINLVGTTVVPGPSGDFASGERAYILDDRGTQRIRSLLEVRALAAQPLHIHTSNRMQDLLVDQFNALKRGLWGFDNELACSAAIQGSRRWMESGLEGLATVCFEVAEQARTMSGGGAIVSKASALAWMMMHEA